MGFVKMLYIRGEYGMRKTAVLTMILMIFCLIGVAESADIVSNGDFEDWTGNDPNSWTTIGSGITITSNTSITYQGTSSASVELTTSIQENTDFSQTVSVTNGTQYFVSVWLYHTEGNMKARLYVAGYRGYSDNSTSGSWQQLSYTYTASANGDIEIGLRFYDQDGFDGSEIVYVDGYAMTSGTPNSWINELHYDNAGTDLNEGVEVVIQNPYSYDLSDFKITLYPSGGASYGTHTVDSFTEGTTSQGFTLYYKMISGLQNGPNDGLALSYNGIMINGQCLSYEGTFTATNGDANGVLSTDIGVSEGSGTITQSLQLTGNGTQYSDFSWSADVTQTWGTLNNAGDQSLPVELTSFTVDNTRAGEITLNWVTESEIENLGFILERRQASDGSSQAEWIEIASYVTNEALRGQGSVTYRTEYSYTDKTVEAGETYDYRLADVSYAGEKVYHALNILGVEVTELPEKFMLLPVYPNPFNPTTTIRYNLIEDGIATLTIYDVTGRELTKLVNTEKPAGSYELTWNADNIPAGVYFCKLVQGSHVYTQKLILLK